MINRIVSSLKVESVIQVGCLTAVLAAVGFHGVRAANESTPAPMHCVVSILPLGYFVERVGGEYVEVEVLVGPGRSPATYEPTARQLANLARSRVYFAIGVGFENAVVPRIRRNFPDVDVIDTRKGVELRSIETHRHLDVESRQSRTTNEKSKKESNRDNATGTPDPHVWLSPRAAIKIAENIRDALTRLDGVRAEVYITNCEYLIADLERVDREVSELLSPLTGSTLFVFHPAYGYFADAYGLVQVPIEIEGAPPGPRHLTAVIERAREEHVKAIFVQPQFSATTAEAVSEAVGAKVVPLDPLAKDYLDNLIQMANHIVEALADPSSE